MLCCGLGKQKPHVHGGKLWEGGAEGKNTSMLPGLRGQGAAAANRAGPLHPWVPKVWSPAGSWYLQRRPYGSAGATAGTQHRPVPALLGCGTAWGFPTRGCSGVGTRP